MASTLSRSLDLLRVPANALGFLVRSQLRWTRGAADLGSEAKDDLFDWLEPEQRRQAQGLERQLRAAYDLQPLRARSSRLHYYENLAALEALERLVGHLDLPVSQDGILRAVDVGCGAFQYATALQRFYTGGGTGPRRRVVLRGIEVDAYGIYRDGHSRSDHAVAHARLAGDDVHFQIGDFLALRLPEQDIVSLCYPFLTRHALLQWGLPLALFRPQELLQRCVATVRPGGLLLVANQTPAEYAILQDLLAAEPVERLRDVSLASQLVPYCDRTEGRVGSVWRRHM